MIKSKYGIKINIKKHISLIAGILISFCLSAQVPAGYYDSAEGLYEAQLQQALHDIIDNHTVLNYSDLWIAFEDTDHRPGNPNEVWDMYSDTPGTPPPYVFTFGSNQCGEYNSEGDCYNREHSWPDSWYNDASPMHTDLVHLVPTDGWVNNKRSNYAFGEVDNVNWTSQNGSKLGYTNASWTSDMVFEPIDDFKGDFARIYFYMSVRYYGEDGSFVTNDMVDGSQLKQAPLDIMLQWHYNDPVSQKEQVRNNAIYDWQGNRNPFVDRPEFVEYIWDYTENSQGRGISDDIQISPVPADKHIMITWDRATTAGGTVVVYDLCGQQMCKHAFSGNYINIDVEDWQAGMYFLRINNASGLPYPTRKIIVK
ncbi:MAG: endonuclease [Bacteroidales bacterium]